MSCTESKIRDEGMPRGIDETLPVPQMEMLSDSFVNEEICTLVKESAWRMKFMAFNYLRSSSGEAEVLTKLEINS